MFGQFGRNISFYCRVIRSEWKHRHDEPLSDRKRGESDFLPAMLEIQETPPHPMAKVTMWLIVLLFIIAIAWMVLGTLDIVVTATGKILPDNRIKIVQAAQNGIVEDIFVKDGTPVKAGDNLLSLDKTLSDADEISIKSQLSAMRLEAQMTRLLASQEPPDRAPQLSTVSEISDIDADETARQQLALESLFYEQKSRIHQLQGEITALKKDLIIEEQGEIDARQQMENERQLMRYRLQTERHQEEKLSALLPIAKSEYESFEQLHEEKIVSRIQMQQSQEKYISLQQDLQYRKGQLSQIEAESAARQLEHRQKSRQYGHRAKSLREQIANREQALRVEHNRFRREMRERHNTAVRNIVELEQNMVKAKQAEHYHRIVAPVNGIVQQLAIHTRGAVVQAGQALLVIVPEKRVLEMEAFIQNKDIGFVHTGQAVEIKIDAFPYTKYGLIDGEISHISADAIEDEKLGLVYQARIKLHETTLIVEGKEKPLASGMSAVAEVKTGERRIIEFFMSPLIQHGKESLKER